MKQEIYNAETWWNNAKVSGRNNIVTNGSYVFKGNPKIDKFYEFQDAKTKELINQEFMHQESVDPSGQSLDSMHFKNGGAIPERYKKLGFSRVGQKLKSTNPNKKWMVLAKQGEHYKIVHGGQKGMQDFSQHHDKQRQKKFWQRMGGYDSERAKNSFSPLYWHKKFGTWEEGGEIYSELEEKHKLSEGDQLYKQGTIKVAWIGENPDILESKMYNDIEVALEESKDKQYLVFELDYSDDDYYRWKLLPYGMYNAYQVAAALNTDVTQKNTMKKNISQSQIEEGKKVELEHASTIEAIKNNPDISVEKAAEMIAKDHLSESPDYYKKLKEMEDKLKDGGKVEESNERIKYAVLKDTPHWTFGNNPFRSTVLDASKSLTKLNVPHKIYWNVDDSYGALKNDIFVIEFKNREDWDRVTSTEGFDDDEMDPAGGYGLHSHMKNGGIIQKRKNELENAIIEGIDIIGDDEETKEEYITINSKNPSVDKLEGSLISILNKIKDEYGEDEQWEKLNKILIKMKDGGNIQHNENKKDMKEFYMLLHDAQADLLGPKKLGTGTKVTDNKTHVVSEIIDVMDGAFLIQPIKSFAVRDTKAFEVSFEEFQHQFKRGAIDIEGFEHTKSDETLLHFLLKDYMHVQMVQRMKEGAQVDRVFRTGEEVIDFESGREYIVVNPVSKSQAKYTHPVLDAVDAKGNEVILATELLKHPDSPKSERLPTIAKISDSASKYAGKIVRIVRDLGSMVEIKFYSFVDGNFIGDIVQKSDLNFEYKEGGKMYKEGERIDILLDSRDVKEDGEFYYENETFFYEPNDPDKRVKSSSNYRMFSDYIDTDSKRVQDAVETKVFNKMKEGGTMQFEPGATTREVNDLIQYIQDSDELTERKNKIYQNAYESGWDKTMLSHVFKNAFSYKAEKEFRKEPMNENIHLTNKQRDELGKLLADEFTLWKIDNDIELAEGGEVEAMWINMYDTLGEAERAAKFLSEKLSKIYKVVPSTYEPGKWDLLVQPSKMNGGGKISQDVIERFITEYNLHGINARVMFKGDPSTYYTKNISPDRKTIFVVDVLGNVRNKKIVDIIRVDNKKVSIDDVAMLEPIQISEGGGRMSEEKEVVPSMIDAMKQNMVIYMERLSDEKLPEPTRRVLNERLAQLKKIVSNYEAFRASKLPKPEPVVEAPRVIAVTEEPLLEEPTQIRTPEGTVPSMKDAIMPVEISVTPADANQYYIILDENTRQKVKDALYYRKVKYSSIVLPDRRTKLIIVGSNNLDTAYAFYEKFKQKKNEEVLPKESITGVHLKPGSAKARMIMSEPSTASTMASGGRFRMCPIGTEIQTLILSKDQFQNQLKARKWLSDHGFKHEKVDEKENTLRYRQQPPSKFDSNSFRTINITKGVAAVIACPVTSVKERGKKIKKKAIKKNVKMRMQEGNKIPTIKELKQLFDKVNADIIKEGTGESVVALTDSEYYSTQIQNIYELNEKKADSLAKKLAKAEKNDMKKRIKKSAKQRMKANV